MKGQSHARAKKPAKKRAPKPAPRQLEAQVEEIVREMTSGAWQPGRSHAAKAHAWGVSVEVVYERAAEAGRVIRRAIGPDRDAIMGAILARCREIGNRAAESEKGYAAAIKALELEARLLRLIDVPGSVPREPPPWMALTPAEQLERVRAIRAHAEEQERRLVAGGVSPVIVVAEETPCASTSKE